MARKASACKIITGCFVWVAITVIWPVVGCLAAELDNAAGVIRQITPMTERSTHRSTIKAEDHFDIVGILNLAESNRIIVGNSELRVSSGLNTSRLGLSNIVRQA
jgi:hypothetical protein